MAPPPFFTGQSIMRPQHFRTDGRFVNCTMEPYWNGSISQHRHICAVGNTSTSGKLRQGTHPMGTLRFPSNMQIIPCLSSATSNCLPGKRVGGAVWSTRYAQLLLIWEMQIYVTIVLQVKLDFEFPQEWECFCTNVPWLHFRNPMVFKKKVNINHWLSEKLYEQNVIWIYTYIQN